MVVTMFLDTDSSVQLAEMNCTANTELTEGVQAARRIVSLFHLCRPYMIFPWRVEAEIFRGIVKPR